MEPFKRGVWIKQLKESNQTQKSSKLTEANKEEAEQREDTKHGVTLPMPGVRSADHSSKHVGMTCQLQAKNGEQGKLSDRGDSPGQPNLSPVEPQDTNQPKHIKRRRAREEFQGKIPRNSA